MMNLYEAAIRGYEAEKYDIQAKIAELRSVEASKAESVNIVDVTTHNPKRPKLTPLELPSTKGKRGRKLSKAGRARIAAATKARWAAFRKAKAAKG